MRRTSIAALAALTAALAGAPPAQAADTGSIAFLREGDVWIAAPDGSGAHRVTSDGATVPYLSVSQADDGTLVVSRGATTARRPEILRLRRNGAVLGGPFAPRAASTPPGGILETLGPFSPRVSPNGATIAYDWALAERTVDPFSPIFGLSILSNHTGYMDAATGADRGDTDPLGSASDPRQHPSWVDDARVIVSDPSAFLTTQFFVAGVGAAATPWFDTLAPDPILGSSATDTAGQTELTRAGDRLAWHARPLDQAPDRIQVSAVTGLSARPAPVCAVALPAHGLTGVTPSWSPDGASLVYSLPDGVWRADSGGCGPPRLILAGGGDADWGPASPAPVPPDPVPAGPQAPAPRSPTPGGGTPDGGGGTVAPRPRPAAAPSLTRLAVVRSAAGRRALRLRVSRAGRLSGVLERRTARRGRAAAFARLRRIAPRTVRAGLRTVPLGRLAPGRYRVRLTVADAAGRRRAATIAFRVR